MIPVLSEQAIRDRVGDRSFERGQAYTRNGAIFDTRRQGSVLKARCHGSSFEPYRLHVGFDDQGVIVDADCSCPVGPGGWCKHVAALLLTWKASPEEFLEQENLEAALERRSREELVALVKQMLRQQPELESLLDTPLPGGQQAAAASPEVYQRQARAAFHNADLRDWRASYQVAHDLLAITAIGDEFLQRGDAEGAANVFMGVAAAIGDAHGALHDEEGEIGQSLADCIEGLGNCLQQAVAEAPFRTNALRALVDAYMFDVEGGGTGQADAAPDLVLQHASAAERATVAGWVRAALPEPSTDWSANWRREALGGLLLALEADVLDDEGFLRVCRETGRVQDLVDRLLALGRVEEATAELDRASNFESLGLADLFVRHGRVEPAERSMEARSDRAQDTRVHAWLAHFYETRGDPEAALRLAERMFRLGPDASTYVAVRRLALGLEGRWTSLRPTLLELLRERHQTDALLTIYLDEHEIDEAVALLKKIMQPYQQAARRGGLYGWGLGSGYSTGRALQVAKAAEESHPAAAMEIFRDVAEVLVDQRGRGNYQEAARLLTRVHGLHERLGTLDDWVSYIQGLRDRTRTLRALKEELTAAGL